MKQYRVASLVCLSSLGIAALAGAQVDPAPVEDEPLAATGEAIEDLWWIDSVVIPERHDAADEAGVPVVLDGGATTDCPSWPGYSTPIVGSGGSDVLIFGTLCKGSSPATCSDAGLAVCRYTWDWPPPPSACGEGSFVRRDVWPVGTEPMRIMGDPSGGPYAVDVVSPQVLPLFGPVIPQEIVA
jgi:hypothetical protein